MSRRVSLRGLPSLAAAERNHLCVLADQTSLPAQSGFHLCQWLEKSFFSLEGAQEECGKFREQGPGPSLQTMDAVMPGIGKEGPTEILSNSRPVPGQCRD